MEWTTDGKGIHVASPDDGQFVIFRSPLGWLTDFHPKEETSTGRRKNRVVVGNFKTLTAAKQACESRVGS